MSRGLRNFNPGNIKTGARWNGLMPDSDKTEAQAAERTFCVFRAPWWGIRAIAVILRNYRRKYGLNTIRGIIDRWAPPEDNNPTSRYVSYVAGYLDIDPDQPIDVNDYEIMAPLVEAITHFENGSQPFGCEIKIGLVLAGIEPRPRNYG